MYIFSGSPKDKALPNGQLKMQTEKEGCYSFLQGHCFIPLINVSASTSTRRIKGKRRHTGKHIGFFSAFMKNEIVV
jgi:hypothetical protein